MSLKVFGLIKGTKVGLVIDMSDMSYRPRLLDFQKDLLVSNSTADFGNYSILIKLLINDKPGDK